MYKTLILSVFISFFYLFSHAQESAYATSGLASFRKGVELFDKEKYGSARNAFELFIENAPGDAANWLVDAHYYRALCAVELFNSDAEFLISHFLVEFPESPRTKALYFVMGNFQYRKTQFNKALKWYDRVDVFDLNADEKEEYYFKTGYSYFMKDKFDLASEQFLKIKDSEGKYAVPAKYFYAHIAFTEKKYETAYKEFKTLESDDLFGPIAPYYIIQILYFQNKNDDIIAYAPSLIDSTQTRRVPEISRILGEAYYKTERFAQSIPYLTLFKEKGDEFGRNDAYQLAYAYYRIQEYKPAADNFESVSKRQDSLTQNAFYHLADCYLQLNRKDKALLAFQQAADMSIIPDVQEDAMYNYAKLSYELSFSPFNDAIKAIQAYLKAYPRSRHADEAYEYLSKMFLSTKNYSSAIETIESISKKTPEIVESYQRVCYFRGLEFYNDGQYQEALKMFNKSIDNSKYDLNIRAQAKYWRAEAYYRLGQYDKSFEDFNDFVLTSGAFGSEEFKDAHYNMGYAAFKLHNYQAAITWFRKYVDFSQSEKLTKIADAYNRIGDCYFISTNYPFAIDYYDKSIQMNRRQVDYAMFQKAFSYGLLKKYNEEIDILQALVQNYSQSSYIDDAMFEIANAYKYIDDYSTAIQYYDKIIAQYENSEYRVKAFLQSGMLEYNTNQEQAALSHFKTLIADYPKSDESQKALLIMKNIYIEINQVDEYIEFANNNSVETEVSKIEADSLTYIAAENLYMSGDCEQSTKSFIKYIQKYPEGRYLLTANYYKADCEFAVKQYASALQSFKYIIAQGTNEYTEEALLKSAYIQYKDSLWADALSTYQKLIQLSNNSTSVRTAKIGVMRTRFFLKQYQEAITSAMIVLPLSDGDEALSREVHYTIAKSFYETGDMEGAYDEFKLIADQPKTAEGAEANYRMIAIDYNNQRYDEAISQINLFKSSNTPHQQWVAKSFMVWSDIFVVKDDLFMAKATLESIIKYYPNSVDGVKQEAEQKLNKILEKELDEQKLKEAASVEINMSNSPKEAKLFELDDAETNQIKPVEAADDSSESEEPNAEETIEENKEVDHE
ncbi:MAG: tetratricopeptide repeat protein [Bacteroidales bacterium]|nr:tetratricopeptide repeat protein [Bacteroidales bacterium]